MSPTVSIIIPCFNQGQFLDQCLQSVLNQSYASWECIIVNDGSSDNSEEAAKKWIEKDSRFKYLFTENRGVCHARNLGADIAKGTYLLPLDADDYISDNYLHESVKNIDITNSKIVFGRAFFFGEKDEEFSLQNEVVVQDLLQYNKIHCCGLFRKNDFVIAGGYDENMKFGFEDWELWINMLKKGGKAAKLENSFLFYRIKENSRSTIIDNNEIKNQEMLEYILKKHIQAYGYNSIFEMYNKNLELQNAFKNLHTSFSFKTIFFLLLKKIKDKFKKQR